MTEVVIMAGGKGLHLHSLTEHERNGNYRHGRYTKEAIENVRYVRETVRQALELAGKI